MRSTYFKNVMKTALAAVAVLLLGASVAVAQQQVNLTAAPTTLTLPDGNAVPMWGYTCGTLDPSISSSATCATLNSAGKGWSPVVITVPSTAAGGLQINLTNNLPAGVPETSIVIVGQLGGGLGSTASSTPSPDHSQAQASSTWPIVGANPDQGTPPVQGNRVQSFSTPAAAGATVSPVWANLKPGTYLFESGTHPSIQVPMGLYGILVVTTAPVTTGTIARGTAYPGVSYDAEVPVLFSEIDPVQNNAVNTAVGTTGFSETAVWSGVAGSCGDATVHTCYPPAVNYKPLYYLVNGLAFDKTNSGYSLFSVNPSTGLTAGTSQVLVRMVNAGLRMHVPSIVGSQTGASAAGGFSLIAEDGNPLPGVPRVQSEVFMAAGKTYDVMINAPAAASAALPIYDRELSLSGNSVARDAGMLAYISVNGSGLPSGATGIAAAVNPDTYNALVSGQTLTISDPSKGVLANDVNVSGVVLDPTVTPTGGTPILNPDGTFTFAATASSGSFAYCANGLTGAGGGARLCTTVTLNPTALASDSITCGSVSFTASNAKVFSAKTPGLLAACTDAANLPLTVQGANPSVTLTPTSGSGTIVADANGGFNVSTSASGTVSFSFTVQNGVGKTQTGTASVVFPAGSGLKVSVVDGKDKVTAVADYRWIIEEDRTFYIDPKCTTNPPAAGCPTAASGIVPTFGTNFHTSYMPVVATGCVGTLACESGQTIGGLPAACDVGNGICHTDATQQAQLSPADVVLDPTKRYYISVLPGDAGNSFENANGCLSNPTPSCGHGMGGAPIPAGTTTAGNTITVLVQANPFPPAKLSVFVFEDDFPLNGEQDAGGGIDVLATNEPGLGGFNITLFDDAGGTGDATGQMTYDMFNMPLSNSLAGTIDPATGQDACPVSRNAQVGFDGTTTGPNGITGTIVTCPRFEADGVTLSPLAGQAVIANMMPGRYGVVATPAADRIARGEEWLQTNTLDGQKAHDSFLRIGEPSFFQEFGPAGYHVSIGFANPTIINARHTNVCNGTDLNLTATDCTHTVTGSVSTERMSRTPDERLYGSGSYDSFAFTQCYVSLGDTDGEDFAFTKCDANGNFRLTNIPPGDWRVTVFDQWNDMLVDGLSTPVRVGSGDLNMPAIAMNQWQANIYTTTFDDLNGNGVRDDGEPGLPLVVTNIRFRDGSFSNFNNTDLEGNAGFNEVFPLFSWYVIETDSTRYKNTGTHVVYDAGGPSDGSACDTTAPCGTSNIAHFMANTYEAIPVPSTARVPGAVYCDNADCTGFSIKGGPGSSTTATPSSTGRIDPAWVQSEGWQGFSGQNSFLEFGKTPFAAGENGGIHGHVIYASTRPFDDPTLLLQTSWEPLVPNVAINLYQEGLAADGVTQTLTKVDSTLTSSWDAWAQGFRSDGVPNMNCPGQGRDTGTDADIFFFTLYNQPMWLDFYNNTLHGTGATPLALPGNSQFKCYDGMHNWNQVEPAPYDGMYSFPSIAARDPQTGAPTGGTGAIAGTNCTICVANPTDGTPMLPSAGMKLADGSTATGKYVVEVVVPPGYELVKEEDKNILIGDNYISPVTQEFAGLADVFILPDQAEVASLYNGNNPQNPTQTLGRTLLPSSEGDTGSVETFWPCVGQMRIVPDFISLFPQSAEVSPFAGANRPLCDRKEVTLTDQASVLAKFYIFTSAHAAAHFTGVITDDFTSEFDPFSPQFGEKFSPPNLPIAIKDWTGAEIARVYTDQWGTYNGLTYSTWEVNPPNPTGYAPTMMITCMNDPGTGATPDPLFNPEYSQFCYEIPFMPAQTQYMDTPVVPTSAFAGAGYNNPDCAYPDATPAIAYVTGDTVNGDNYGPYVSAGGHTLTIEALGDQTVPNNGYSGPSNNIAPFNQKTLNRHYGFGTTRGTGHVTIGGVNATVTEWTDLEIKVTVPNNVPQCSTQQQAQYGGSSARCGELLVTAGNGKQSIDSVVVTVGGKAPTHVKPNQIAPTNSPFGPIQQAIDAAAPGDLIIVDPGAYQEIVLMWKPVRLQGAGAASTVINANSQPAGRMDPWRATVSCLFGLARNGQPFSTNGHLVPLPGGGGSEPLNPFDSTGQYTCPAVYNGTSTDAGVGPTGFDWKYYGGGPNNPQIDRIPLEGILGWDTTLNGNLAELLQEPTLMGAYEGAGITVLAKGVRYPAGLEVFGAGRDNSAGSNIAHEGQFPAIVEANGDIHGTLMLTSSNADCNTLGAGAKTGYSSNFMCNPSRIDGLSVTDSSQGGGGIYVHGWGHKLEISNNRVYNNTGTLTGGITVGQGESPDALLSGNNGDPVGFDQQPWTCNDLINGAEITNAGPNATNQNVSPPGTIANQQLPYCYNEKVNVHNNYVTRNSSIGDELFSSTPAGAGGVTFCTGSDYYQFNYNWVCGNLSTGDGGGLAHLGFSWNGDIEHNTFLFNQSTNPTVPTNGGALIVMGAAPDGSQPGAPVGSECGSVTDVDCAPGLSDGTGPNLVINANLIMGNSADSGSGGGIRLQDVNGTEVGFFPNGPTPSRGRFPSPGWNSVLLTNNIIANNVAGWDGAGISLQDALRTDIVNNTIVANDSTASAGVLFNTLGAPLASAPGDTNQTVNSTQSAPQAAGLVTMHNTSLLTASLPPSLTCPPGHTGTGNTCRNFSIPLLDNNVFWENRAFYIGVGSLGAGTLNQQHVVALYNAFIATQAASQPQTDAVSPNGNGSIITGGTGACVAGASFWDIGVRGDLGPSNHASGLTLTPNYSVITDAGDYSGHNNTGANPSFLSQYCNGSRTPPELGSAGYAVPPGISDATVPNPIFNLTPAATVDEGNNWINMSWGPLTLTNVSNGANNGLTLGNYSLANGSPAIDYIPSLAFFTEALTTTIPTTDFFGNARPSGHGADVGAVEFQGTNTPVATLSPAALNFGNVAVGHASSALTLTLTNPTTAALTSINVTVSGTGYARSGGTCTGTLNANANCTIFITLTPAATGEVTGSVSVTASGLVDGSPVQLTGTGVGAPTVTGILPNTGTRGTSESVTVTGTNFTTYGTTLAVSGAGVTVSNVVVQDTNTITATFTIGSNAATTVGPRNVTVTTAGGSATLNNGFTVQNPPPPTLTSISPNSHARGGFLGFPVTLTGTNFVPGSTIAVSGGGFTITNVTVVSSTQLTATFRISGTATRSARNVTVTTPGGSATLTNGFTVN